MPFYDYICEKCDHTFQELLPMSKSNEPCEKACPHCKKKKCVIRNVRPVDKFGRPIVPGMSVDATLSPDKVTGGQFSEVMNKIKKGVPERFHHNLDRAIERRGNG